MSPQSFKLRHEQRIRSHADRVEADLSRELVECLEHPEWGVMTASEAARRVGTFVKRIRQAVEGRSIRGGVHWFTAGQRAAFRPCGPVRNCCQPVRCLSTGERYECVQDAIDAYGLKSRNSILDAMRRGTRAGGVRWGRAGARPAGVESRMQRVASVA